MIIPIPGDIKVWLATGQTDMRKGMNSLALQVQEKLGRNPHAGDLFVFRGKRADRVKMIWHDGLGMSLYLKRLERGAFIWPTIRMGPFLSLVLNSTICCRALIGAIRCIRSDRLLQDDDGVKINLRSCIFHESPRRFCDSLSTWI